jgi:hypothetical protein
MVKWLDKIEEVLSDCRALSVEGVGRKDSHGGTKGRKRKGE